MIPSDTLKTVCKRLGREDAVRSPLRRLDWASRHGAANRHSLRKALCGAGLPWRSERHSDAGQKQLQRSLDDAAVRGLLVAGGSGQALTVRLTPLGDAVGRSAVALPPLDSGWSICGEVRRLAEFLIGADVSQYGELVHERYLSNVPMDVAPTAAHIVELGLTMDMAKAAIAAGWLACRSDVYGNVLYQLTPLGDAAAAGPEPEPPAGLPEATQELADVYSDELMATLSRLRSDPPLPTGELGEIPLPASLDVRIPRMELQQRRIEAGGPTAADKRARRKARSKARK